MRDFITIHKYEDGTVSYWHVQLDDEEFDALDRHLDTFAHCGYSVRGRVRDVLEDLANTLESIDGVY